MSLLIAGLMFFTALMLPTVIAAAHGDSGEEIPLRERVSFLLGASGLSWIGVGLIVAYGWKYFEDLLMLATGLGVLVALAFLSNILVESASSRDSRS